MPAVQRSALLWVGGAATLAASLLAFRLPAHGDMAAHFYRTLLVRRGDYLWDNLWYRGDYPIASYSLLYYLPAARFGNAAVAVAATVAQAVLYAVVVGRTWGTQARAAAWVFAVAAVEPLVRSEYPFALGTAFMLATLATLQRQGRVAAAVFALLTLATSPLAFGFLFLAVLGIVASRPRLDRSTIVSAGVLAAPALLLLVATRSTAIPWSRYPFPATDLVPVLVVGGLGVALARHLDDGGKLQGIFAVWIVAAAVCFLVPTPIGLDIERPLYLCVPLLLVPLAGTPRSLRAAVCILPVLFVLQLGATVVNVLGHTPDERPLWSSAVAFLRTHQTPSYRVEVVPTAAHWEAYYLPAAGFAISRGWYRQLDLGANGTLYATHISPAAYRRWLGERSVDFVILTRTLGLDGYGAAAEARLLRSGRSGLTLVRRTRDLDIFAVRDPVPLLRPATLGTVTAFTSERIAVAVRRPGTYELDVAYMPYWEAPPGVSVRAARDDTTILQIRQPGRFVLTASSERLLGLG